MKKPTRSPLKDPPVPNPGQSLEDQRLKLVTDRLITPLLAAAIFGVVAMHEWVRMFMPRNPMPWMFTAVFKAAAGFFLYRVFRTRPAIRRLKQARDGERAVGQYLERANGYEMFHDLIGDVFNVDHVLIGPAGVFTIEAKSYSKPASGPALTSMAEYECRKSWTQRASRSAASQIQAQFRFKWRYDPRFPTKTL